MNERLNSSVDVINAESVYSRVENPRTQRALDFLVDQTQRKLRVVNEGPPIYLWPALPELDWKNAGFRQGWGFINEFDKRLPDFKGAHYVMIDDMNYAPRGLGIDSIASRVQHLANSSDQIASSAVFSSDNDPKVIKIFESELFSSLGTDRCSVLDAAFNMRKITDQLEGYGGSSWLYPENIERLMMVVVSPDTRQIRSEQLNMVQSLYEQLRKHPAYEKVSKTDTRRAITDTYKHVWLDNKRGEISSITSIDFSQNHFMFKNLQW